MNNKVLLAYSGGLDTSVILHWLMIRNYDVTCALIDVGQEEDFESARKKALQIGASSVHVVDAKNEFVEKYIFPSIATHALYEGKYLLGTSLARPLIAEKLVSIARSEKIQTFAHGATGKGNDQVRFELTIYKLMPEAKILSPWKTPEFLKEFSGRPSMIEYSKKHGIPITSTLEKPYSIDENLMHTSFEAGRLENALNAPTQDMFKKTVSPQQAPDKEERVIIEFQEGIPVCVEDCASGKKIEGGLALFQYLNQIGGKHGIGRIDMVESRFVGLKSRGVYETPAGTILRQAHLDLEGITLDREVMLLKESMAPKIAQLIYNGFWFSPEMEFLMAAINQSQKRVSGRVHLTLYKGNVIIEGRESEYSLYDSTLSSMDEHGGYDQTDAKGFIRLNALRLISDSKVSGQHG